MPTITHSQQYAIRTARETAASAEQSLRRRAGDGPKARPSLDDINSTLDRLTSVQSLLGIALEPNAGPAAGVAVYRAEIETRHWHFEAFGFTADEARASLLSGLEKHAEQCNLQPEWAASIIDEARVMPFALGACYRDREPV